MCVPTVIVHRRNEFIPLAEAELMAAGIPEAELVVLDGEDHLRWVGDTADIVAEIGRFVGDLADEPPTTKRTAGRSLRPASGWASLSPAERRVALLVSEGLTNPEVADRLFVSRYTVETHLKRIVAKLGLRSRTQLASIVIRNT